MFIDIIRIIDGVFYNQTVVFERIATPRKLHVFQHISLTEGEWEKADHSLKAINEEWSCECGWHTAVMWESLYRLNGSTLDK